MRHGSYHANNRPNFAISLRIAHRQRHLGTVATRPAFIASPYPYIPQSLLPIIAADYLRNTGN